MRSRLLVLASLVAGGLAPETAPAALPAGFADELVVAGLSQPVGMAFLPDGRILVVEQKTRLVRLVAGGVLQPGSVLSIPDVNISGNERGLLGIAVDPGWPARPYIYCYFDRTPGNTIYISRFTGSGDLGDPGSGALSFAARHDLLTDIPDNASNHNGGTLHFGPDGMLYASVGEDADPCAAQDSTRLKGVILRMDVSGLPAGAGGPPLKSAITPADNPFPPANANAGLTFAYGLRNPFRFTIDPATGDLVVADVGQDAWEELDIARGGENFGWPFREAFTVRLQGGCAEPGGSGTQAYDAPILAFAHGSGGVSLMAGPRYRMTASPGGEHLFAPLYNGAIFYSEYYSGVLRVVRHDGAAWTPLPAVPGQPNANDWGTGYAFVSQWVQGRDGAIYYVQQGGSIRRIVHTGGVGLPDEVPSSASVLTAAPNPMPARGPGATLSAAWEAPGPAVIEILDARGRLVRRIEADPPVAARIVARWDGRAADGSTAAPGVYFARLRGAPGPSTRLVLLP